MTTTTSNYGIIIFDRTSDINELFIDFRDLINGNRVDSAMNIIDTEMFQNATDILLRLSAASTVPDGSIVRGDDGTRGVQSSVVYIDNTGNMTGVDSIKLDAITAPSHSEGLFFYDTDTKTHVLYNDISDVGLNIGEENWVRVVNKTGGAITNGQAVYVSGAQGNRPTVLKALADASGTCCGTIAVITQPTIADNAEGISTSFGIVRDIDTSGFTAGDELFLSSTVAGAIVNTAPTSPNFKVRLGWALNSTASGAIFVNIKTYQHADDVYVEDVDGNYTATNVEDILAELPDVYTSRNLVNGTMQESFDALITSDGTTITMSLEKDGTGDLTMQFSDGNTVLDCTPADTIALTAGTSSSPQRNFVYIPQTTKVLTLSTTGWLSAEHIKIGFFYVQDAVSVQTDGALINQNWNDELCGTNGQGHITHIGEWIRSVGAKWFSGCDGGGTSGYITTHATGGTFQVNAGVISQMHKHSYAAKDTSATDDAHCANYPSNNFKAVTDLNEMLVDSTGGSLTGRYYNIILGGVANKGGEYSPLMIKLPSGSYNSSDNAINDVDFYDDISIASAFAKDSSTGFLMARITIRNQSDTTFTIMNTQDLRGFISSTASGGGGGTSITEFADNHFKVYNNTDATKIVAISASGITTGNTRTITMADEDITLTNAETTTTMGTLINSATAKTTPVDADMVLLMDSADSNAGKKLSWANIKATLKTWIEATTFSSFSSTLFKQGNNILAKTTSFTLALTDNAKYITMSSTSATTITVPQNSSVAFPIGTEISIENINTGDVTITAGSGATVNNADSFTKLTTQYRVAMLKKRATDIWTLVGVEE